MNEEKKLNIYDQLKAPFEKEALKPDKSRWNAKENKGIILTSITPQYIVDRLNIVFGIYGWDFQGTHEKVNEGVLFHGELTIKEDNKSRTVKNTGFCLLKKNLGDMYKSASTDCLSKCASYIGVGDDVFKGKVKPPESNYNNTEAPKKAKYIMPFGKQKGKHFDQIVPGDLLSAIEWCTSKNDEGKFTNLIDEIKEYLDK